MNKASRFKRELVLIVTSVALIGASFALPNTTNNESDLNAISIDEASQVLNTIPVVVDADVDVVELLADGKHLAYFETRVEADKVLKSIKDVYRKKSTSPEKVSFVEDVEVEEKKASIYDFDSYMPVDDAVEYLTTGTLESEIYTIEEGDTVYDIARRNDLTTDDIYAANPELAENKYLQIGQEIKLIVPKPILNVKIEANATLVEDVEYEVIKEDDDSIYEGDSRVIEEGILGQKKVRAKIVSVNGKEVSREVLKSEILKEPKAKLVAVGTKERPKVGPTGDFVRPVSSYIVTAWFGERRSYSVHKGIDLAMSTGSDVRAADGGTITHAGWKGSYGYLVIIDHGGGRETYYAHLSAVDVHVGQVVGQGEHIARSGNTGRSTGPHLHFEMRIGGTPVNPTRYVSF